MAHAAGLAHGKDIVWTYGPLGYLTYPVAGYAGMYTVLLYKLGVYFLWCVAVIRLSLLASSGVRFWVVPLLGIAALIDPFTCSDHLLIAIFAWSLLLLMDRSPIWRAAGLPLLAFLSALACLIKANSGVAAICLFTAILTVIVFQNVPLSRAMRWMLAGAVFLLPLSLTLLYAAETGTVASLPAYVRNSLEIASGYSEAMSINGPTSQILLAVISMAVFFLLLPLLEGSSIRGLAWGYLPALVYVFFAFKACMVRQDAHAANFELQLALAALFPLVFARKKRFLFATMCFQVVCLICSYKAIAEPWPLTGSIVRSRLLLVGNKPAFNAYRHWRATWAAMERDGWQNLVHLRVSPELQSVIGEKSIEVLPWDVTRVHANAWNWRPRPIFQTYAAYTPRLDRLNAEHLRNGPAADFALANWIDIDARHPFLETPLSWQTQLDLYQTVTIDAELLLLGRRTMPRFQAVQQLRSETVTWDQEIYVPQSPDPIIVSAHIDRSITGLLRSLFYRSNPLWVDVTRKSGNKERYRVLRANFADGVIINELPTGIGDLALLGSGCSISDPVVSFRLHADSPGEFRPAIPLQWARLVRRPEIPGNCVQPVASATQATFPAWGGIGTIAVSAGLGAQWSVTTNDWITTQPRTFSGNATVSYVLLKNTAPEPRQGTVDIGGHPLRLLQRGLERGSFQFGLYNSGQLNTQIQPPPVKGLDLVTDFFTGFAVPGDQLVIGDWTGNGMMRIGVFRHGQWYLDLNGNRRWDGEKGGDGLFSFGLPGDIAAPGDWTGDGKTKLGVFRKGVWVLDNGNMAFDPGDRFILYGQPGDIPVVGKWSHDRADRVGVFRNGTWIVDSNGDGQLQPTDERFLFGLHGDFPIVSFGNGNTGVYRNGLCILAPNGIRNFDTASARMIPCGGSGQSLLIAAW